MAITLYNLVPAKGSRRRKKRVGRGNSSGSGTYSGRGQKGQRSRSGGKKGLKLKGIRRNIRNLPKLRGFKSISVKPKIVHLEDIYKKFKDGDTIDPKKFKKAGFISNEGRNIKVLCKNPYNTKGKTHAQKGHSASGLKKLTISAHAFSQSAQKLIKKAGGKVVFLP